MAGKLKCSDHQTKLDFLPRKLHDKLMPFQKDGIIYGMSKGGRCLIADEMGLGKTVQALSIAYYYRHEWPLLIIVPASLRYPWIEEIEKWIPEIHPHDINLIQGGADISQIPVARITVVTYGLLRHPSCKVVQEALYNQQFRVVIVDESHYIKNRKAATTKYVVSLLQRSTRKILLTGTPALARPEELFPQIDSILPGQFGSWTSFAKNYCDAKYRYFGRIRKWVTDGASNLEELENLLKTKLMVRRLKKDVLTQLPPKQRQRITFQLKESDVKKELDRTFEQLNIALGRKQKSINSLLSVENDVLTSSGAAQNQSALDRDPLQVAEPATASTTQIYSLLSELHKKTCAAKIGPVKEYLKMLCDNEGLKFIIFAYHRVMMDSLAEQLVDDDVKFIRIDGQTPMQDRPHLVKEFQVDESIRCALLSIKAAGVGLTLTAGKLVVFAELDWTPGTLEQCEDRAHRIGQTDPVHVHYLVAKGTLDERVWAALCRKTTVITTTLNGKRQVLKMADGDDKQVECLANADVYKPKKREPGDLSVLLRTPQPKNQKSIADFFTPKGHKSKTMMTFTSMNNTDFKDDVDNDAFVSPASEECKKRKRNIKSFAFKLKDMAELCENDVDQSLNEMEEMQRVQSKCRRLDNEVISGQQSKHTASKERVNTWSCTACTFINNNMLPYCEMCSSPKQGKQQLHKAENDLSEERHTVAAAVAAAGAACAKTNKDVCANVKAKHTADAEHLSANFESSPNDLTSSSEQENESCKNVLLSDEGSDDGSGGPVIQSDQCDNSLKTYTQAATPTHNGCDIKENASSHNMSSTECLTTPETDKIAQQHSGNDAYACVEDSTIGKSKEVPADGRMVDLDSVPVFNLFKYCCSKNTSRIYLYDESENPLNTNFTPLDVEMENYPELPELLLRPENLKLVKRFVREWNSLAPTKRRLIVKSGEIFTSPSLFYEKLKSTRQHNTQRYTSKVDIAAVAVNKAEEIGGSVRVIRQPKLLTSSGRNNVSESSPIDDITGLSVDSLTQEQLQEHVTGIMQVVSEDGTPLCIHCQKPYFSELVAKKTIENNIWQTRFCSQHCMDQYWMKGSHGYSIQQVYQEEHGICQLCGFDAQTLYDKIKNTTDLYKRAKLIQESKYGILKPAIKQKMASNPVRGLFWQVDHIKPVVEGGGACDIDNLRTLCVLCHREVTAQLHKDRAKQKHMKDAAKCGDITAFFKIK